MSRDFHTTRWTVIIEAGKKGSPESRKALEILCATYWYPLYAYARRRGYDRHKAEDLTQCFFTEMIEKNTVSVADATRGRFRTFLLAAFNRFAGKKRLYEKAQKRGGGQKVLHLDFDEGERSYSLEPAHSLTPERLFNRRWAVTLLDTVLQQLRAEMDDEGRGALFDELRIYLLAQPSRPPYREVAERMKMAEGALKVAVHRLRSRYRDLLRAEIAHTVNSHHEVDMEIHALMDAVKA